jgi:hypothetical protein
MTYFIAGIAALVALRALLAGPHAWFTSYIKFAATVTGGTPCYRPSRARDPVAWRANHRRLHVERKAILWATRDGRVHRYWVREPSSEQALQTSSD